MGCCCHGLSAILLRTQRRNIDCLCPCLFDHYTSSILIHLPGSRSPPPPHYHPLQVLIKTNTSTWKAAWIEGDYISASEPGFQNSSLRLVVDTVRYIIIIIIITSPSSSPLHA
jgi:hypothetical protein